MRRCFPLLTAAILAHAAALVPSAARAAVPEGLTEQGRLFDGAGAPLDATVSLTFSITRRRPAGRPSGRRPSLR